MKRLQATSPERRHRATTTYPEETPRLLHGGRLDLAVGYMPSTGSGLLPAEAAEGPLRLCRACESLTN